MYCYVLIPQCSILVNFFVSLCPVDLTFSKLSCWHITYTHICLLIQFLNFESEMKLWITIIQPYRWTLVPSFWPYVPHDVQRATFSGERTGFHLTRSWQCASIGGNLFPFQLLQFITLVSTCRIDWNMFSGLHWINLPKTTAFKCFLQRHCKN